MSDDQKKQLTDEEVKIELEKILADFEMKAKKIIADFERDLKKIQQDKK